MPLLSAGSMPLYQDWQHTSSGADAPDGLSPESQRHLLGRIYRELRTCDATVGSVDRPVSHKGLTTPIPDLDSKPALSTDLAHRHPRGCAVSLRAGYFPGSDILSLFLQRGPQQTVDSCPWVRHFQLLMSTMYVHFAEHHFAGTLDFQGLCQIPFVNSNF